MRFQKIFDNETGEILVSMYEIDDIENIDPIKYYGDFYVVNKLVWYGVPLDELMGKKEHSLRSNEIFAIANELWKEKYQEIKNTHIPPNLLSLLETSKKRDQEKLLKGIELNPMILCAFIFEAFSTYGFRFSQYTKEVLPKGIDMKAMPIAAELLDNGEVKVYGKTALSQAVIKQAILHRSVNVGKFLERGDIWHCLFANYKSLNGDEIWLGKNQPHLHYISNSFGLSREKVVSDLRSKNYNLGNLPHIKLNDYGHSLNKASQ